MFVCRNIRIFANVTLSLTLSDMNNDIQNHGGSEFSAQSRSNSKNVILVDADYVDKVAFNLIVNFERMIGRRIPQADMAKWIDCVALDGGIREGEHETQVVLIHSKEKIRMENFAPGNYKEELTGKAFKDHLGEFVINAYPTEDVVSGEQQFVWSSLTRRTLIYIIRYARPFTMWMMTRNVSPCLPCSRWRAGTSVRRSLVIHLWPPSESVRKS